MENKIKQIYYDGLLCVDDLNEINDYESIRDNLMALFNENIDNMVNDIMLLIHPEINDIKKSIIEKWVKWYNENYDVKYNVDDITDISINNEYTCKYSISIYLKYHFHVFYHYEIPYYERDLYHYGYECDDEQCCVNNFINLIKQEIQQFVSIYYNDDILT